MDTATDFSRIDLLLYLTEQLESGSQAGLQAALAQATLMLGMEFGIISRVVGDVYTVERCAPEEGYYTAGQELALEDMVCRETLRSNDVLAVDDASTIPWQAWSCFSDSNLLVYIGVPLVWGGRTQGTLCFGSSSLRARPWIEEERQLVRLLGHWVEAACEQAALRGHVSQIAGYLAESNRTLRSTRRAREALLAALPDPLLVLDLGGVCRRCQVPAGSRLPFRPADALDRPLEEFLAADAAAALRLASQKAQDSGLLQVIEVTLADAGQPAPRIFEARVVRGNDEPERAALVLLRDLTDREEARRLAAHQAELQRTNHQLRAANQELETFAYAASHDLKSPLRALANLTTLIEEDLAGWDNPRAMRCLGLMRERVERLTNSVNDLLAYSQVGRDLVEVKEVQTAALAREIVQMIAPPESLHIEIDPGLPTLRTAQMPLEQVLTNGIANAVQHHDRLEGHILISAQNKGQLVEFRIQDDGPGVPDSFRDEAFAVFRRLQGGGTGLGLALVRKTVESVGGQAWLEPALPRGTVLAFTWPRDWPSTRGC